MKQFTTELLKQKMKEGRVWIIENNDSYEFLTDEEFYKIREEQYQDYLEEVEDSDEEVLDYEDWDLEYEMGCENVEYLLSEMEA